jgi:hypothetical protein
MPDHTSDFFRSPIEFMKKNTIHPPDNANTLGMQISPAGDGWLGRKGSSELDLTGFTPDVKPAQTGAQSLYIRRMPSAQKTVLMSLVQDTSGKSNEGRDVFTFRFLPDSLKDMADIAGYEPIWFLPWADLNIIRLTIPVKGTSNPDPDIFFTAAINGCSVFIQGTARHPTVYHAGGVTNYAIDDAARFWREAVGNLITHDKRARKSGVVGQVSKKDYIAQPGVNSSSGKQSTTRATEYEDHLRSLLNKKGRFTVTEVSPWGCFMGLRTNDTWAFYLQENATVWCTHVQNNMPPHVVRYARTLALRQIYPGGGASFTMKPTVPTVS